MAGDATTAHRRPPAQMHLRAVLRRPGDPEVHLVEGARAADPRATPRSFWRPGRTVRLRANGRAQPHGRRRAVSQR
ncbi:hypothetical protein ACFPM0_07405 [Pseudonocardia sulfidoxydans]|uniref:hypothetical protein n=1 Tax=Pseudonocardia sulfidoxydans TaxID=54011 RepID=UPI003610745C